VNSIHRILDANGNRAAEGLRVLEEVARFVLDDSALSARAKDLRHALRAAVPAAAVAGRDTAGDVGTTIQAADEATRRSLHALIRANAARVQEALRALEEFAKLSNAELASCCERTRYGSYDLERDLLARLPVTRLWQGRLYVLVDTGCTDDPVAVAAAAARGGACAIQLRAKGLDSRAYRELAAHVRDAVGDQALFVVNDHVALVAELGAAAVHVGQSDLPIASVRAAVGPLCAIGHSTHSRDQVCASQADGADYIGIGPMFATGTKPAEPVRGPALLAAASDVIRVPSFAIGGLTAERIAELKPGLPHGVAVAGAVCRAADPERACAELCALLEP
jgi:thiamine-phosphate pyrophosphorylase